MHTLEPSIAQGFRDLCRIRLRLLPRPQNFASAPPSLFIRLRHFAFSPIEITPARHTPLMLCSQFDVAQLIFSIFASVSKLVFPVFPFLHKKRRIALIIIVSIENSARVC